MRQIKVLSVISEENQNKNKQKRGYGYAIALHAISVCEHNEPIGGSLSALSSMHSENFTLTFTFQLNDE